MMSNAQDSQAIASTSRNRGASVNAATWVFASVMVLVVLAQVTLKWAKHQGLDLHDHFIIAAMVIGFAQAIAVTEQVNGGLGRDEGGDLKQFQMAGYASELLYLGSLGLSKVSSAYGSARMSPVPKFVQIGLSIMLICVLWSATSLVAAALQCTVKESWQILQGVYCFDQTTFWTAIGVLDLILDFTLFNFPFYIVSKIQGASWSTKTPLILAFGSKLLVIPVIIARLLLLRQTKSPVDPTWDLVPLVIVTQLQMNLSILTTSIPHMKICSSRFANDIFTTGMRLAPPKQRKPSKTQGLPPLTIRIPDKRHLDPTIDPARHLSVRGSAARSPGVSSLGSSKMFINKLTTFWVEEEPVPRSTPPPLRELTALPPVPTIKESFYEEA